MGEAMSSSLDSGPRATVRPGVWSSRHGWRAPYKLPARTLLQHAVRVKADIPYTWECRVCGARAILRDGEEPESVAGRHQRTPPGTCSWSTGRWMTSRRCSMSG